jgi:CBS domain-containing protein
MKIRDVMSKDVQVARPGDTLQEVASRMAAGDFGFMPVAEGDTLIGTITDRDIAVRAVAQGAASTAPVVEYISRDPHTARADDDLKTVLDAMGTKQIRRLPVLDKDNRLVGVVSLGDLSTRVKEKYAGETLEDISRAP